MQHISITERLEESAGYGLTNHRLPLYPKKIQQLRRDGYQVTELAAPNSKRRVMCLVDWSMAQPGAPAYGMLQISLKSKFQ